MDRKAATGAVVRVGLLALALAAGGCSHLHWSGHKARRGAARGRA